jgi:non-canonical poly(A) RNA polymerase PAPD5/7
MESPKNRSRSRERDDFIPLPPLVKSDSSVGLVPWVTKEILELEDPLLQLHEEVINFYNLMQPNPAELDNIEHVIARLDVVVKALWSDATVKVFGSVETGLWLPNSDIDVVVFTALESDSTVLVNTLASALIRSRFASELERILTARVPLVKIRDRASLLCLDISFNMESGVEGVRLVKDYLAKYPEAKYIVCVLKYFLKQRGLSETYNGGVGSYLLFCMVVSSIQQHPSRRTETDKYQRFTLAHYLLHFFRLYGDLFNFEKVGVSLRKQGHYFDKRQKGWLYSERRSLLAMECPQNQENDLGRNSFSIDLVKKAFSHAYKLICACGVSRQTTPLQTIIKLDPVLASRVL